MFVRFWGIGHPGDGFAGLFVRFCRIGHLGIRRGGLGGFGGYGEVAADLLAGVEHEFPGHRDFAGFLRQASFLHVRLVDAVRSDFLHGRRFAAVQVDADVLRPLRLHLLDAVDGTQRGDIVIRQSRGGQHLDVVQALGVEEPIGTAERVPATRVYAGEHGHAQQGDHGDRNEPFPRMRPHTQHVFDERHHGLPHTTTYNPHAPHAATATATPQPARAWSHLH